jgi:hypothetical protein
VRRYDDTHIGQASARTFTPGHDGGNETPPATLSMRLGVTSRADGRFMSKSDEYRANAVDCMRLSAVVGDSVTKLLFVQMADAWLRLADHAELGKLYEPRDGSAGPPAQDGNHQSDPDRET